MKAIKNGALFWPMLGWNILAIPGFYPSQEVTYVNQNQYIQAPSHAWVHKNATPNQLSFHGIGIPSLGANEIRTFTTDE